MNVETLKYFQYIAKYKNITQAAKHLYISQSTLSRHIMTLENELGVRLFERNNKMVTLTEAGKILYNDSDSLIDHMDSLTKNVISAGKGHSGILKITAPKSMYFALIEPLAMARAKYPDINFFVESYDFNEIPLAIKYKLYNIGFTYNFALFEHENLDCIPVGTDSFSIAFSTEHLRETPKATLKHLAQTLPFIFPSYVNPPFVQQMLAELQTSLDCKITTTLGVNTSDSMILNTSLGLGYGLLPNSWADLLSNRNDLSFIDPPNVCTDTDIVAICKKSTGSELTTNFMQLLKDRFS